MDLEKILQMLGVEKLDESQKNEISEKLQGIVEVKAEEMMKDKLSTEKDKLVEEYEKKFEEYKEDITNKFSNFLDSVLDEELNIPEKVIEYARKGELYEDLIEQFKTRLAIDEGLLDNEVKELLREAKKEIINLRNEVNSLTESNLEVSEDAKKLAVSLYIHEKCDGLTESKKSKVMSLLEDITDKEKIDAKFDIILETIKVDEEKDDLNDCVCPECGKTSSVEGSCSASKCPDCEVALKESSKSESHIEGNNDKSDLNEDDSPFSTAKKHWLKILQEGKL